MPVPEITETLVDRVSILAQLEMKEEERRQAKEDMGRMLGFVEKLQELDVTGIEPLEQVLPVENVYRPDEITNPDGQEDALANAPARRGAAFLVPITR